jgi:Lrp/AsnC family transcriptional regulator, regulator for asnA, asnC and gidA
MRMSLDDLDRALIAELQEDGRRPFREIARTLEVSEATVRARVRRLQDAGVLRIVAFADPVALGHSQLALVFLTVRPGRHDAVLEALVAIDEVAYVSTVLGEADICAQVLVRDESSLWRIVNDRLRAIDGVESTRTIVEVEVHKLRYPSPVRRQPLGPV